MKLTVGAPGDRYEQEADLVADQVMSMPDSATQQPIQRETALEDDELQTKPLVASITPMIQRETIPEEEEVQTKPLANPVQRQKMPEEEDAVQTKPSLQRSTDSSLQAGGNLESRLNSSKSGGSPLPQDVKTFMEPRFGADFSQVRVHTDSEAIQMNRDLNAQAFTHKQDVYFGAGKAPGKNALTAHELTHVVQQTGDRVQRAPGQTWIGERINWVRTATHTDNWANADPPGAFYILNGLSMDDMVRVLRALTPADRKKLSDNLDENGAGFDRPRIQLALTNAETASKDKWWQDLSEKVHWAIRSNKFVEYPDGAFWIINPLNENDSKRIMKFLNRDSLDELIANGKSAVETGVPNAQRILRDANQARGSVKSTKNEQYLIDLIDGNDWKNFFTKFNELNENDKLRFLRNSFGATAKISNNIDKASGISDQDYLRNLIEKVTNDASTNLYVDAMVKTYNWQPKYCVNDPKEFSRIIRFGNTFDVEIDISSINDGQMSDEEADKQFREAKPGPGGFLWPSVRNRSTLPILWQVKQDVHKQMETLLFDEVLADGILVINYLLDVVFPVVHGSAMRSLKALNQASLSGRWMKGSQVIKGRKPPSSPIKDTPPLLPQKGSRQKPTFDWTLTPSDEAGMGHLDYRHAPWSKVKNSSKFTQNAWNRLRALVDETVERGTVGELKPDSAGNPQAGVVYENKFIEQVGINSKGKPLYKIRVVVDANNHVTTTFPF
ncbi:MAG: DUF4157 domain-containing protein [Leptolyngbyaceae cyanobacterium bins.349]|nr:DUF4157 domain-containing protein [Leptolyngbyaceae cyanobacterium bins.349]